MAHPDGTLSTVARDRPRVVELDVESVHRADVEPGPPSVESEENVGAVD